MKILFKLIFSCALLFSFAVNAKPEPRPTFDGVTVTAALHSPLMSVTNAISSVIIVGALIASGPIDVNFSKVMGFLAVVLASVNIFGGFIVSQRMLQMFRKKG